MHVARDLTDGGLSVSCIYILQVNCCLRIFMKENVWSCFYFSKKNCYLYQLGSLKMIMLVTSLSVGREVKSKLQ